MDNATCDACSTTRAQRHAPANSFDTNALRPMAAKMAARPAVGHVHGLLGREHMHERDVRQRVCFRWRRCTDCASVSVLNGTCAACLTPARTARRALRTSSIRTVLRPMAVKMVPGQASGVHGLLGREHITSGTRDR